MNRVLRRPMFKMGGSTGTGITSGLDKPRQNYQEAGSVGNNPLTQYPTDFFPPLGTREIKQDTPSITMDDDKLTAGQELLKAFKDRNTKPDLSQFLINFGLNLASATPRGNIFATAAEAAKKPAGTLFDQKAAEKAFDKELTLAATKMDINERLKKEAEERAFKRNVALKALDLKKDDKAEDQYVVVPADEAKAELGTAYNPKALYQRNLKTNKLEVKLTGPKEVIKETTDEYLKTGSKAQAEADVKKVQDAETAFLNANKFTQTLDTLRILANTPDDTLETGAFAELRTSLAKIGQEFGLDINVQNVPLAELLRTVGGKVAIDSLQGFKGAISNKELEFVQDINPGLSMSKDGIKLQLLMLDRANDISKRYYTEVVEPFIRKNGFDLRPDKTLDGKTFNQLTMMFHDNNPYVTDDIRNQLVAATVNIDEKYKKNIVTDNGVNYIKIGEKFYQLPNQTDTE